ncbi:MAG: cytochrome P450 [Chlorogloeopsis fritschii C42_A2020_084]|uniref:cytochrome P450 n=1 Tax=Chlorogloeopsis fritschii TaxID=1124 RepID=UPI0019F7363C|nr:cytochrome P450 [Chlorogloeopsis fritschii]MBF2009193.1 cytochrome P450 [Chlorogloeopsis fritschii C42_A2020_084]
MINLSTQSTLPLPPGRLGLPAIGESISYLHDPAGFIAKRQQQHGNIFKTHLFARPTIVLIGADAARFLFSNDGQKLEMTNTPNFEILLGAKSIGVQTGATHQILRRQLFQAFQPRALENYAIAMEAVTRRYLQKWEQMGTLTWYEELKKYTLDIACRLFVGVSTAADESLEKVYEAWSEGLLTIPIRFPGSKFDRAVRAREELLARFDYLIEQRQQHPSSEKDVLSILLVAKDEAGNSLSRAAIKDNILGMLIAGHETLTSALTSLCLLLAQHPKVLEAVRTEQAQLGFPTQLTQETLKQMIYLEQVLKEVLRIAPPVVRSGSRKVLESCEFGGYLIPQGWDVYYQIPETHQDSQIYTHPEQFDPDRFSPERTQDKQKLFSHIPFGGGIRECLGKEFARLEMKLFAALLVRDYKWELVPGQNLERVVLPFSRPRDGLKVKFSRR